MGARREGREAAIQFLYQRDLNAGTGPMELDAYYRFRSLSPSAKRFCDRLIRGALEQLESLDENIRSHADNYDLHRLSAVDRNVLRLATYEIIHCPDTPPVVAINEAIEIAKKYSTEESGKFVNGILDRIRLTLGRPGRARATPPPASPCP